MGAMARARPLTGSQDCKLVHASILFCHDAMESRWQHTRDSRAPTTVQTLAVLDAEDSWMLKKKERCTAQSTSHNLHSERLHICSRGSSCAAPTLHNMIGSVTQRRVLHIAMCAGRGLHVGCAVVLNLLLVDHTKSACLTACINSQAAIC